jgi:hypothetical protein
MSLDEAVRQHLLLDFPCANQEADFHSFSLECLVGAV